MKEKDQTVNALDVGGLCQHNIDYIQKYRKLLCKVQKKLIVPVSSNPENKVTPLYAKCKRRFNLLTLQGRHPLVDFQESNGVDHLSALIHNLCLW